MMKRIPYKKEVGIFIIIYGLFSIAGLLFPVDKAWYSALKKPTWTPSGQVIGFIWAILFGLISLATVILSRKPELRKKSATFYLIFVINYFTNQAFSFFQFKMKDLLLATIDCFLVAFTAFLLVITSFKKSRGAALLLLPYFLWSAFATYLSYTIYSLNK